MERATQKNNEIHDLQREEGHTYAYGGASLVGIVLLVLLLIWIF
jgi:hypothetical protein